MMLFSWVVSLSKPNLISNNGENMKQPWVSAMRKDTAKHVIIICYYVEFLRQVLRKRFFSMSFPPQFSGPFFPVPPEYYPPEVPDVFDLPSYYFVNNPHFVKIPFDPKAKRALLYERLDLIHFHICKTKKFHSPSIIDVEDNCLCKFCNERACHYHHKVCPFLKHLNSKALLARVISSAAAPDQEKKKKNQK